ncbi:MAG: hypothetical protein L0G46_12040, partial [Kocuria sp.]|nr:hypothetical protein [Kocuria sp.]
IVSIYRPKTKRGEFGMILAKSAAWLLPFGLIFLVAGIFFDPATPWGLWALAFGVPFTGLGAALVYSEYRSRSSS